MRLLTVICLTTLVISAPLSGSSSSLDSEEIEDPIDWDQVESLHQLPESLEQYAEVGSASDRVSSTKRIYGGKIAEPHSFPYQVGLLIRTSRGVHWCGGALISNRFVVTAAHCVDRGLNIMVFLGAHEIRNADEPGQKRIGVHMRNVLIHHNWYPRFLRNDIALVRLPKAIQFDNKIQPISLPSYGHLIEDYEGQKAVASGWGKFSYHSKISYFLRYFRAPILNLKFCRKSYPKILQPSNICVSGAYDRSTCSGDSGGPLVVWDYESGQKVLVGITSFGSILGCDKGYPSVFTRITSYLDWISDNTDVFIE